MDFATTLKHKRQEFSVPELIGSLDVEERVRAKTLVGKEVRLLVPIWYKRTPMRHINHEAQADNLV